MPLPKKEKDVEIKVLPIIRSKVTAYILGETPLIFHQLSMATKKILLLPPKKTKADLAGKLKHNPLQEYRDSVYVNERDDGPTRLMLPSPSFKAAVSNAALDIPGTEVSKAAIGRLVWVEGYKVPVWGVPQLFMCVVRMSDIAKTPDIRTRAICPRWAAEITLSFTEPRLRSHTIEQLLAASGIFSGVGDWRQQKGKGSFGMYKAVDPKDPEYLEVQRTGGREAQDEALKDPTCYDNDSFELFSWYNEEVKRRGMDDYPRKKAEEAEEEESDTGEEDGETDAAAE